MKTLLTTEVSSEFSPYPLTPEELLVQLILISYAYWTRLLKCNWINIKFIWLEICFESLQNNLNSNSVNLKFQGSLETNFFKS